MFAGAAGAMAQTDIAIKSGETLDLEQLYWVANCKSNLKSMPTVEVLDAPENLSVGVKDAMLLPRRQNCSKTVPGGVLQMTAKDVKEISTTRVVLRVKYPTRDGDRVRGYNYNVTMVP